MESESRDDGSDKEPCFHVLDELLDISRCESVSTVLEDSECDQAHFRCILGPQTRSLPSNIVSYSSAASFSQSTISATSVGVVFIPSGVRELGDHCFHECRDLSRVHIPSSSTIERIGKEAFCCFMGKSSLLREIDIPDSVRVIDDECFRESKYLSRVTFGPSSRLERIGVASFSMTGVTEIHIPDSVKELGDGCFFKCLQLTRVTFSRNSSLRSIGTQCFQASGLEVFRLPRNVTFVGGAAFGGCSLQNCDICGNNNHFRTYGPLLLSHDLRVAHTPISNVPVINVPDFVTELAELCFCACQGLRRLAFTESSQLVLINPGGILGTGFFTVMVPDATRYNNIKPSHRIFGTVWVRP